MPAQAGILRRPCGSRWKYKLGQRETALGVNAMNVDAARTRTASTLGAIRSRTDTTGCAKPESQPRPFHGISQRSVTRIKMSMPNPITPIRMMPIMTMSVS